METLLEEQQELSTYDKLDKKIIYGRKVILFAFEPVDLDRFVELHQQDEKGYMLQYCLKKMDFEEARKYIATLFFTRQVKCWSVYIKKGFIKGLKDNKRAGFVYLTDFEPHAVHIAGIMDTAVMRGLLKHLRRDKLTFAEDTLRTLCNYLFNEIGLHRATVSVLANNRRSLVLNKKCGFKEEGRLREAFQMDDKYFDIIQMAILKKEWKDESKG